MLGIGLVTGKHTNNGIGDNFGICLKKAIHHEYTSNSARIRSYDSGWTRTSPRPVHLAEAGFYFTGTGDVVQCYYCGLKLRRWDVYDNPWIEHARHGKDCPHVLNVKGKQFYKEVHNDIEPDGSYSMTRNIYTDDLIFTTAARALQTMNCYTNQQIKNAIRHFVSKKGSIEFSAEDLALILCQMSPS